MHRMATVFIAAPLALPLFGPNPKPASQEPAPVFRSETSLAMVPFHVVLKNRFVVSLTAQDVILLEDGKPQPIALFEGGREAARTTPIDVLLLFDASLTNVSTGQLNPLVYKTALLDELPHVRLAVHSFNGAVLRRFCRPTRDAATLTSAVESLVNYAREPKLASGDKSPFKAIPLKLARQ